MGTLNTGRLILGGLAAGLVINVVEGIVNMWLLVGQTEGMLAALNLEPVNGAAMGGFALLAFLVGIMIVWIYASIRPRFGPGPATAMKAGFVVWAAFYAFGVGANWLMGIAPTDLYLITLAYTLAMMLAAAYVGGMVYKEE